MAVLFDPYFQAISADGIPFAGAKLYFYRAGTTSLVTVYSDAAGSTPRTNPVVASAAGLFPPIYLSTAVPLKYVLKDADGVTILTVDRFEPVGAGVTGNSYAVGQASDLPVPSNEYAEGIVLDDPDPSKNGYWYRSGGAWTYGRPFPDGFAKVGNWGGSVNAQTASVLNADIPTAVQLFFGVVEVENTGPMTLDAGAGAKDVVSAAGTPLSAGEWTGAVLFFLNDDGQYQLVNDAGAAAAASASAAAAAASEGNAANSASAASASADEAAGYAAGLNLPPIEPGDAGKSLFVKPDESGYELSDPTIADGDKGDIVVSGGGAAWTLDQVVSQDKVVTTPTDALRITISNLTYPGGLERTGDTAAAAANLAAIQAKVGSKKYVELGDGTICINDAIQLGGSGLNLVGSGENGTILMNTSTDKPSVKVTTGSNNIAIWGMTLDRTTLGLIGGDGINFAQGGVADGLVHNIYSKNNYNGVALGGCGYARAWDIFVERNRNNGIDVTNSNAFTTCQWYLRDILSQLNGGDGFRIQSVATAPVGGHMALGEMVGCRSFANTGRGLIATGNATVGVYSLRVSDCFFGEDGGDEVYLNTYGSLHTFDNCFLELGGSSLTGPTYSTPASHASYGFMITANTPDVTIDGGKINGMAYSGIYNACPNDGAVRVIGTLIANNGINGGVADVNTSGLVTIAGAFDLVGVRAYGQRNGLFNASLGKDQIVGCDFNGNSVAKIAGNQTSNVVAGNR